MGFGGNFMVSSWDLKGISWAEAGLLGRSERTEAQDQGGALATKQSGHVPSKIKAYVAHVYTPICSMVLEYLPTFARTKSPSFVGKSTSTMEHLGLEKEPIVLGGSSHLVSGL